MQKAIFIAGLIALLAAPALVAQPAVTRAQAGCQFLLGFRTLHDMIPQISGQCIENEWHNAENGDGLQRTTTGLMAWRKADNWTAFTDGATTWINGPFGLQSRPNDQRFAWEAPAPAPAPPATGGGTGTGTGGAVPTETPVPGAPAIELRLSDDRVDQDETFTVTIEANDPGGLESIWWWATDTDDDDLRDTHTRDCNNANPCRRSWDESTDDTGDITFHARARNSSGVESQEVTLELRVREAEDNDNESAPTPTSTPQATATATPAATATPTPRS